MRRLARALLLLTVGANVARAGETPAVDNEPAVSTQRMPPEFWEKNGWRELKWGMGPGDALERAVQLPDGRKPSWLAEGAAYQPDARTADPMLGSMFLQVPDDGLLDGSKNAKLVFGKAGLESVTLEADLPAVRMPEMRSRFAAVVKGATARHGKPACNRYVEGETCKWMSNGTRVEVRLRSIYANLLAKDESEWYGELSITYANSTAANPDDSRLQPQLPAVRVAPARWSDIGVYGVRLGMGMRDVLDRIGVRGQREVACHREYESDKKRHRIRCQLDRSGGWRDLHFTELRFTDAGRLSGLSLAAESDKREFLDSLLREIRSSWFTHVKVRTDVDNYSASGFLVRDGARLLHASVTNVRTWSLGVDAWSEEYDEEAKVNRSVPRTKRENKPQADSSI